MKDTYHLHISPQIAEQYGMYGTIWDSNNGNHRKNQQQILRLADYQIHSTRIVYNQDGLKSTQRQLIPPSPLLSPLPTHPTLLQLSPMRHVLDPGYPVGRQIECVELRVRL